jgi:hypothetical protein
MFLRNAVRKSNIYKKTEFIMKGGKGKQKQDARHNSQKPDRKLGSNAHPGPQKHGGERKEISIVAFP